jgi:predicted aldo/keto reductase-like oxidoreductase
MSDLTTVDQKNRDLVDVAEQARGKSIAEVFSATNLAEVKSFGGLTLAENAKKVDLAIANVAETERIWNRSHSQWTWRHINLSYAAPMKNLRQVSAEMTRKREALEEAKWNYMKNEIKLKQKEDRLAKEKDSLKAQLIEIDIAQLKSGMANGMKYVEGAMKDVLTLSNLYDDLKEKYSDYNEEDFEKEEARSHLKRSLVQCLRDVRQSGRITKGEQEYLEQIGVNPGKITLDMLAFLDYEQKIDDYTVRPMYEFLDDMCVKLLDQLKVDEVRMQLQGLRNHYDDDAIFLPKKSETNSQEN